MNLREYEIMYRVEERHWWYRSLRGMLRLFWRRHGLPDRPRVLDVGCGTGANLDAFQSIADVHGIDFAEEAIRFCRKRDMTCTAVASAIALPFAAEAFDAVISCDVLSHQSIQDKQCMLREVHRVLKPGGVAILNVPAYQWLRSSHDDHVQMDRRFSRSEMVALLQASAFTVLDVTYWNTLLFPAIACVRLWRKRRPAEASDLAAESGGGLDAVLYGLLGIERVFVAVAPLPFGLSVMVAARKA